MGKTKGLTASNYLEYIRSQASPAQLEEIRTRMTPESREELMERAILPISWVEYAAVIDLLNAADVVLGSGDRQLLRELSARNQRENLHGVYRAMLRLLSIPFLIEQGSRLWRKYHACGSMRVQRLSGNGSQAVRVLLVDYPSIPEGHEAEIEGAFQSLVTMAGAKWVSFEHETCVLRGDAECSWRIAWG